MSTTLSLDILQSSWDKSNRLYLDYRNQINRIHASWSGKKVEAADTLTNNTYRKLAALEQERRKHFGDYYQTRGIKCYPIEAIHVGKTRNDIEYTESELRRLATSLSFVRLNINHVYSETTTSLPYRRALQYPANQTLVMRYDPILQGIFGMVQIEDYWTNTMIEKGRIGTCSIEHLSLGARDGTGLVGTGLALLTSDTTPGDARARIFKEISQS